MITSTVVLVVVIVATIIWTALRGGKLPTPFGARSCQGKNWRLAFPDASKSEIRLFLSTFTESFEFNDREKLKLSPNDQLLNIYRALYPHKWQADALEFETLAENLESKYGVTLNNMWHKELTLGELFTHIQQSEKLMPAHH